MTIRPPSQLSSQAAMPTSVTVFFSWLKRGSVSHSCLGAASRGGVDCSCLVQNVYSAVGIHLPRAAADQFNATSPIREPHPGDLLFFANTHEPGISHVGIYIGNGLQINAPTTGEVVSLAPVFTGYWGAHYAGARQVRT